MKAYQMDNVNIKEVKKKVFTNVKIDSSVVADDFKNHQPLKAMLNDYKTNYSKKEYMRLQCFSYKYNRELLVYL